MATIMKRKTRMELPDHLRGFAVLSMILIHILNQYGSEEVYGTAIFPVLDFLAGPPAGPVFMAAMGFFYYLKNPAWQQGVKRGLMLLLSGYILNLLKGWIPVTLAKNLWGFRQDYFPELFTPYYLAFNVEILILAGLSYLLMTGVNSITRKPRALASAALAVIALSPYLWGLGEAVPVLKHLVRPLWGQDVDFVIFPLFPWGAYAFFGMLVGAIQERLKGESFRIQILWALGAGIYLLLLGGSLLLIDFNAFFNDYGQQGWGATITFCGFILLWGLLFTGVSHIWPEQLKPGFLLFMSRNLTVIYFLQWIIIGWLFLIIPYHSLNLFQSMATFVLVTAFSCGGAALYNHGRLQYSSHALRVAGQLKD